MISRYQALPPVAKFRKKKMENKGLTPAELEKRRRMKVALWAYAYEFENDSLVSDYTFDEECKKIDLSVNTDNPEMDAWFREHFSPYTGMWVRNYPNLYRLRANYILSKSTTEKKDDKNTKV